MVLATLLELGEGAMGLEMGGPRCTCQGRNVRETLGRSFKLYLAMFVGNKMGEMFQSNLGASSP